MPVARCPIHSGLAEAGCVGAGPRSGASCPLPGRIASASVAGIARARPRRPLTTILTAVPAWPWLLLLAALLAPAVFVELPLRVGNRRVRVAGLYEGGAARER